MSLGQRLDQARDAASNAMQAASSALVGKIPSQVTSVRAPRRMFSDAQYFNSNTKADTLFRQLDSDSTTAKLEAMKKIVAQLSKGKDVSEFFPAVVKNVSSPSLEVKKLVYLYVIHYAEEKHDEALLSIAHFQKDLTDKSQHVRALSLRVMSSIRVPIIVQIVLLAIRKCVSDPAPWVRKSAALAIPKMYRLAQSEKGALVAVIDELLGDHSSLVLGAAALAFNEVCPDRVDLLHKHFRKMCKSLVDVDEWGQVVLLHTLLHYGRTQFLSPFGKNFLKKKKFYEDDQSSSSRSSTTTEEDDDFVEYDMDQDHRLLLKSVMPLLQSRNHAVIVGVATLHFHLAPVGDFSQKIAKALMRMMKSTRERQYAALHIIHSFASRRASAFRSFVREFFVTQADPAFIQKLKIDVIALLADSSNVSAILREYKYYLHNSPPQLLVDTVRALGRVAFYNADVSETCLHTLAELTSHSNSIVVAESVVVTRHLLQKADGGTVDKGVVRLSRLLDSLRLPVARASLVWLLGEHCELPQVSQVAPDSFRKLVKGFASEEPAVKQQICLLGTKLMVHSEFDRDVRETVAGLYQHMLQLCRYDEDYSIRDRMRLYRALVTDTTPALAPLRERARSIFVTAKKEPDFHDPLQDRLRFQVGTLSHMVNSSLPGYRPLPDFPTTQPDGAVRDTQMPPTPSSSDMSSSRSFFSSDSQSDSDSDGRRRPRRGSSSSSVGSDSDTSSSSDDPRGGRRGRASNGRQPAGRRRQVSSDSDSDSDSSSDPPPRQTRAQPQRGGQRSPPPPKEQPAAASPPPPAKPRDSLLDFMDDIPAASPPKQASPKQGGSHADPFAGLM